MVRVGCLGGTVVKNLPSSAGERDSIPGSGRCLGVGNFPEFLENSMDRGAWWSAVHGVTKRWP